MKQKHSLIFGLLMLMLLALAACAAPAAQEPAAVDEPEAEAEEMAEEEERVEEEMAEEEGAAAPSGEPIVIGSTLSLTGGLAPTAIIHKITGDIYVEWLNENGGLLGRPVEWIVYDDESQPDRAASLYERLATEDEVDLMIGPYGTGNITAAMQVAERYGYVFPHHTASLTYAYTYERHFPAWFVGLNTDETTPAILYDALEASGNPPETIAFVTNQFPGTKFLVYGQEGTDSGGALRVAEEYGYEVVLDVEFPTGTSDFTDIAAQIREADPDFLYIGAIGVDGVNLINAMQTIGYEPDGMFMQWPAPGPLVAMGEPAEGVLSVTMFEEHEPFLSYPGADVLVPRYKEAAAEANIPYDVVEVQAAASWSAWQILTAGVEGAGSLDQDAITEWLLNNQVDSIQGPLTFDPEQQNYGADNQSIKQLQDGDWVVIWPEERAAEGAKLIYSPE